MKKRLIPLLLLLLPLGAWAQSGSTVLNSAPEEEPEPEKKVMVIPFHPIRYYFSDCDKNIGERSRINQPDVRTSFRAGLDYAAERQIAKKYASLNLLQMKDSTSQSMMERFYDNVSYSYAAPSRNLPKANKNLLKAMKKRLAQQNMGQKGNHTLNAQETYATVEDKNEGEYMALTFRDSTYFQELHTIYQADYYVTINQFEIKTDYEHCIDRDLGKFTRRIKVHYNVFDKTGTLVYGDVVTARYDSKSDDFNQIVQDNFGFLAEYILNSVPRGD